MTRLIAALAPLFALCGLATANAAPARTPEAAATRAALKQLNGYKYIRTHLGTLKPADLTIHRGTESPDEVGTRYWDVQVKAKEATSGRAFAITSIAVRKEPGGRFATRARLQSPVLLAHGNRYYDYRHLPNKK